MRSRFSLFAFRLILAILLVGASAGVSSLGLPPLPEEVAQPAPGGSRRLLVAFRNDDLSVLSDAPAESAVLKVFRRFGIPQTFAFIPNPSGYLSGASREIPQSGAADSLKRWRATGEIDFALHGYAHLLTGPSGGEFAGLPFGVQHELLRTGKAFSDSVLSDSVTIFAPPWNQADRQTLEACRAAGIRVFSGYLAEEPVEGITQVNTNAALFRGETTLPEAGELLPLLRDRPGDAFLVVFYHSRVDFPDPKAFRVLEDLLSALAADPDVRCVTLGELSRLPEGTLEPFTKAGLAIRRAEIARDRAKPYLWPMRATPFLTGTPPRVDRLIDSAYGRYWRGQYARTAPPAIEAVSLLRGVVWSGRMLAGTTGAVLILIFLRIVWRARRRWVGAIVTIAVLASAQAMIHLTRPFSEGRIRELDLLVGVCLLIFLAGTALGSSGAPFAGGHALREGGRPQ